MHVNPKRRGRRSDEGIIMVGEAGSKRPPGEGKELIQTNSFIENSIEAGILLGKEHKERGTTGMHCNKQYIFSGKRLYTSAHAARGIFGMFI